MTAADFRMPWGKYKGKRLDDVPLKYLDWLVGEGINDPATREAIETYLADPTIQNELVKELEEED